MSPKKRNFVDPDMLEDLNEYLKSMAAEHDEQAKKLDFEKKDSKYKLQRLRRQQVGNVPQASHLPRPVMVQCGRCMQRYDSNATHTCPSQSVPSVSDPKLQAMLEDIAESSRQYHETKAAYKQLKRETSLFAKIRKKLTPKPKQIKNRDAASNEVRAVLAELDLATYRFNNYPVFDRIKAMINAAVAEDPVLVSQTVREKKHGAPEVMVYTWIANTSGDLLESGEFHMYRGTLNPMTGGPDLLKIFAASMAELVKLGNIESEYAAEQKNGLRQNIKTSG